MSEASAANVLAFILFGLAMVLAWWYGYGRKHYDLKLKRKSKLP